MCGMKVIVLLIVLSVAAFSVRAQTCADAAKQVPPVLSESAAKTYEAKLAEARDAYTKNPNDADAIIWLGRRTAYIGEYKAAVKIFTDGIAKFPKDARFYRHRGHRYITLRCFDDAIRDFEAAAKLVEGKPDEIEPDGLPNARNIPTSTLKTNIYYHLGLAHYVKGNFKRAANEFLNCYNAATNADMKIAAAHWIYMSTRRLDRRKEADRFIETAAPDGLDIIENMDYYKLTKLYRGKVRVEELLSEIGGASDSLSSASLGYGIGNYFFYNGDKEKAREIFRKITVGNQWASFGFIAAEAELSRKR